MDFNKIGRGHRIAAGAGLLLLIDLWLNWYSVNVPDDLLDRAKAAGVSIPDTAVSAWQAFDFTDILLALVALLAIAAAVQASGLLTVPTRLSGILLPAAGLMTLWVLYRIINQPDDNSLVNVEFGAYLGLVLTAITAYGASIAQGETESVGPADVKAPSATTTTPSDPPPPPPPAV